MDTEPSADVISMSAEVVTLELDRPLGPLVTLKLRGGGEMQYRIPFGYHVPALGDRCLVIVAPTIAEETT